MSAAALLDDSPHIVIRAVDHPIEVWSRVANWVERALDDEFTLLDIRDVFHEITKGTMVLWAITSHGALTGCFITKIEHGSRGRALNIIAMGGTGMDDWIESFSQTVTRYARHNNCRFVFEMGRYGWVRVLERLGWTPGPATMMKAL